MENELIKTNDIEDNLSIGKDIITLKTNYSKFECKKLSIITENKENFFYWDKLIDFNAFNSTEPSHDFLKKYPGYQLDRTNPFPGSFYIKNVKYTLNNGESGCYWNNEQKISLGDRRNPYDKYDNVLQGNYETSVLNLNYVYMKDTASKIFSSLRLSFSPVENLEIVSLTFEIAFTKYYFQLANYLEESQKIKDFFLQEEVKTKE